MVLLWVWTGPHVLLWTLCSLWVSLRRRQCLSAAGRLQPAGGRVRISLPVPVGGGSLCLSLVPALLPSLSPLPHAGVAPFTSAQAFSSSLTARLDVFPQPHPPLTSSGFLPFASALPSATASPFPLSSQCSTSLPQPVVRGSRCSFILQDDPPPPYCVHPPQLRNRAGS